MKARSFIRESTWLDGIGGYGCGYVVIPAGHPYHGKNTDECGELSVHGGVTFAESADLFIGKWEELSSQDADGWVIGFDTAHSGDSMENCRKVLLKKRLNGYLRSSTGKTSRLLRQLVARTHAARASCR